MPEAWFLSEEQARQQAPKYPLELTLASKTWVFARQTISGPLGQRRDSGSHSPLSSIHFLTFQRLNAVGGLERSASSRQVWRRRPITLATRQFSTRP